MDLRREYLDEIDAMHRARLERDEYKEEEHRKRALEIMDRLALTPDNETEVEW
jgi:hypothetical protein